jgi:hypothetical protein
MWRMTLGKGWMIKAEGFHEGRVRSQKASVLHQPQCHRANESCRWISSCLSFQSLGPSLTLKRLMQGCGLIIYMER